MKRQCTRCQKEADAIVVYETTKKEDTKEYENSFCTVCYTKKFIGRDKYSVNIRETTIL